MYIKKSDYRYFETLYNNLDKRRQRQFVKILQETAGEKAGEDIEVIRVVDDEGLDPEEFPADEFITRTMIKKAYKAAKEEQK
jgi:hypothetical protein